LFFNYGKKSGFCSGILLDFEAKEGTQYIPLFFPYQEEQLKQGLQKI